MESEESRSVKPDATALLIIASTLWQPKPEPKPSPLSPLDGHPFVCPFARRTGFHIDSAAFINKGILYARY